MRIVFFTCILCLFLMRPLMARDGNRKFERQKFHKHEIVSIVEPAQLQAQNPSGKKTLGKSKKRAFFYSLLVPGLGEMYQNEWKFNGWGSGLYYAAAEALLWTGHFCFKSNSNWLKEDGRSLAARSAGVDLNSPKPKQYYFNIGKFSDIYTYNDHQRRFVGASTVYEETDANFWQWNSGKNRRKYDRMRIDSDNYRNFSQYMFWGIFANHVLSAVNSLRVFRNHQSLSDARFHFEMMPGSYRKQSYDISMGLSVKF